LPYTPRVHAARVVGRLRQEIEVLSGPYPGTEKRVEISASIGFETYDGKDIESVEALRRHAEIALRRCKEAGGNRAMYYRQLPEAQARRSREG
jgi:GGDEF domain-containing protein